ncbi:DUF6415 family natural product biosynthesis protein [Streptomyces viridosporus]|uniref:DUF6415 family natural product biosynthesis protein n=1 Tax=Streptomyces viridosporus TaxID=67581 RepID=UPI0009BE4A3C|nr:DUF6415 family natural product biosynthesis protein [Streptomyces viridosporus]
MSQWTSPLPESDLAAVLEKVREWQPFDGDAVLDDAAAALDDVSPATGAAEDIAERLRGHLAQMVTIAVATEEDRRDAVTAQLIEQARTLSAEDAPGDRWQAIGHLRRMGWIAGESLDRLVAARCLREVA